LAEDGNGQPSNLGQAVSEVSERASLLIREEIELAKAEISEKVSSLIRGAVVGLAAGIFVVVGLLFLLHAAAWGVYTALFDNVYLGYLVVAGILFVLGGLAGFLAAKAFKKGAPPTPEMAIDEAKRIKDTVQHGSGAEVGR
jgi:predicted phage tail protein